MPRRCLAYCALAFLLLAAAPARAQTPQTSGSISGRLQLIGVLDRKVRILIRNDRGLVANDIFADEEGNFGVSGLELGSYTVEVASHDFTAAPETVTLSAIHPMAIVRIPIERVPDAAASQPRSGEITVDVGQLHPLPAKATSEFEHALKESRRARLPEALSHYQAALKAAPDFYAAEVNCGAMLVRLGQPETAIPHFKRAIAIDPRPPFAWLNLGRIDYDRRDYAAAERHLSAALARQPASAEAQLLYGASEVSLGKLNAAERALLYARRLAPGDGQVLLQLYNVYSRENRPADARRALEQFVAGHPDDHRVPQVKAALGKMAK